MCLFDNSMIKHAWNILTYLKLSQKCPNVLKCEQMWFQMTFDALYQTCEESHEKTIARFDWPSKELHTGSNQIFGQLWSFSISNHPIIVLIGLYKPKPPSLCWRLGQMDSIISMHQPPIVGFILNGFTWQFRSHVLFLYITEVAQVCLFKDTETFQNPIFTGRTLVDADMQK